MVHGFEEMKNFDSLAYETHKPQITTYKHFGHSWTLSGLASLLPQRIGSCEVLQTSSPNGCQIVFPAVMVLILIINPDVPIS